MILMYHHVIPVEKMPPGKAFANDGYSFAITPAVLERQLFSLRERGFRFVSLDSMVSSIRAGSNPSGRDVVVTFDDGWLDNYEYAFPILAGSAVPATFFLTTAHLGVGASDPRKVSSAHIREMHNHGISMGGHTRNHPNLLSLSQGQAREEIRGCKEDIEDLLGGQVTTFAYPGGVFNATISRIVEESGYCAACSIIDPHCSGCTGISLPTR